LYFPYAAVGVATADSGIDSRRGVVVGISVMECPVNILADTVPFFKRGISIGVPLSDDGVASTDPFAEVRAKSQILPLAEDSEQPQLPVARLAS
jgi:hypothetical protein